VALLSTLKMKASGLLKCWYLLSKLCGDTSHIFLFTTTKTSNLKKKQYHLIFISKEEK
jgi:hypothetical protein